MCAPSLLTFSSPLSYIVDVHDLQYFVNISLATAAGGKDAYTHDKLFNLRTVGSGFGALIYRLPSDAGYQTLVDRCKTLWETLQSTPNLPDMMVLLALLCPQCVYCTCTMILV